MMHGKSRRLLHHFLQACVHSTDSTSCYCKHVPVCRPIEYIKLIPSRSRTIHTDFSSRQAPPVFERGDLNLLETSEAATKDAEYFSVIPNFIAPVEEEQLLFDIERTLRGKKYQYDHWDGAIQGYRETEKSQWMDTNTPVIQRLKEVTQTAVPNKILTALPEVHALDLAQDGHIKPHIDSVKFCGDVICGLSLLSPSVMKLQHEDNSLKWINALLPRLSLYIMRGVIRYKYTHAVLSNKESMFKDERITKERRVSIISRTQPSIEH